VFDRRKNYNIACGVANDVMRWGYEISDECGREMEFPKRDVIGLRRYEERKGLLGLLCIDRTKHIGNIWLDNPTIGASPKSCWVIENYNPGEEHELGSLVKELGRQYKVQIRLQNAPDGGRIVNFYRH